MSRITFTPLASWLGFCADCPEERPLLLTVRGSRGLRSWWDGSGPEDQSLAYTCLVCGRVEHVPPTEAEDLAYDLTLARWPDYELFAAADPEVEVEVSDRLAAALELSHLAYAERLMVPEAEVGPPVRLTLEEVALAKQVLATAQAQAALDAAATVVPGAPELPVASEMPVVADPLGGDLLFEPDLNEALPAEPLPAEALPAEPLPASELAAATSEEPVPTARVPAQRSNVTVVTVLAAPPSATALPQLKVA